MSGPRTPRGEMSLPDLLECERGISLVELLVGIGIAAGIMTLIGTFVFQFFTVARLGTNRMAVSSDLQSAALWLGRDGAEAHTFTSGSSPVYGSFEADSESGDHEYRYLYDSAESDLIREHYLDGSLDSRVVVARLVTAEGDVSFTTSGNLVSVTVNATSADATDSLELELALRDQTP